MTQENNEMTTTRQIAISIEHDFNHNYYEPMDVRDSRAIEAIRTRFSPAELLRIARIDFHEVLEDGGQIDMIDWAEKAWYGDDSRTMRGGIDVCLTVR